MTLPTVILYRKPDPGPALQCLCVECGAVRPSLRLPEKWQARGLIPVFMAAMAFHTQESLPSVIHMWERA